MQEPFLREITPANLLSFGPNPEPIKLNQLNILIGANGSGKSNLIEVIHVLRSTPGDLRSAFRPGGFSEWVWQGNRTLDTSIEAVFCFHAANDVFHLRHSISIDSNSGLVNITGESFSEYNSGYKYLDRNTGRNSAQLTENGVENLKGDYLVFESLIYQRRDPVNFPEIFFLGQKYKNIRIYREWQFGRLGSLRQPQATDLRHEVLEEDFSNLALHLNYLQSFPLVRRHMIKKLQDVFSGITDFGVSIVGGTAQIYLIEGDYRIPATRLSDGTLRYLCLLAILCNPEPQPLICLEEPELGLHPDLLSGLVDLIKECSARTQMIVTTHSEFIVDGFSDDPESVVVVDKEDGLTKMKRLNHDSLNAWLEEYSLGQLWNRGQIGGTRW